MEKTTESLILTTARKHFVSNGFAGTRMQEIADEAGINKALLHYYFRSKAKLYGEVIDATLNTLIPPLAEAMGQPGTFHERLEGVIETYIETLTVNPDIPVFILSELSQRQESFVAKVRSQSTFLPAIQSFIMQMSIEMEEGKIRKMPPMHLLLNIVSLIVFPFIAKPIFRTVLDVEQSDFDLLMQERKKVVSNFIHNALIPKTDHKTA